MSTGLQLEPARYAMTGPHVCTALAPGFYPDDLGALDAPMFVAQGSVQAGAAGQSITAWAAVILIERIRRGGWQ